MTICGIIEWLAILWAGAVIVFLTGYTLLIVLTGIGNLLKLKLKGE